MISTDVRNILIKNVNTVDYEGHIPCSMRVDFITRLQARNYFSFSFNRYCLVKLFKSQKYYRCKVKCNEGQKSEMGGGRAQTFKSVTHEPRNA